MVSSSSSIISWKDKTLVQIVASVQMNENNTILTKRNLHNAPPIKHYRKEIQSTTNVNPMKSSKLGMKIDSFETPGGILKTKENVINSTLATFSNEKDVIHEQKSETCFSLTSIQQNALNRIRNTNRIKPNYCVDTNQYLQKRGMSIEQNQYNYLRKGDSTVKPGTLKSISNVYDGQISDCLTNEVVYKPNNAKFACQGSVTSSSRLLRKKLDTITTNASKSLLPYGTAVANAMQYGISDSIFTFKNKFAFPTKKTPTANKYSSTMQCCTNNKI